MNAFYSSYIETAKSLALKHGLDWDFTFDKQGKIAKTERWDLAKVCGLATPPFYWISSVSLDESALAVRESHPAFVGLSPRSVQPMHQDWQDFYKATVLHEVLIKRNRPPHALLNIARPLRILATFSDNEKPWEVSASTITNAYNAALFIGESGKAANNFKMFVRIIMDKLHLSDNHPLEIFCSPLMQADSLRLQEVASEQKSRENTSKRTSIIKKSLEQRSTPERLPEAEAFWELMRIVFTEKPKTFSDAIRFCQIKLAVCTGLRVGELVNIPKACLHRHEHLDKSGRPAGDLGGVSHSYSLRYFAEKVQDDTTEHSHSLYEASQHIPDIFEPFVIEAIKDADRLTLPLRSRLEKQVKTGRIFPEYGQDELVPVLELYSRATGSPLISKEPPPTDLVNRYQATFDASILDEIYQHQMESILRVGPSRRYCEYWQRLHEDYDLPLKKPSGAASNSLNWAHSCLKIGEFEDFIRTRLTTKLSETASFSVSGHPSLSPSELLFLMPIRALAEARDGGILDVNRYMAVGRSQPMDLQLHMGGRQSISIFSRYSSNVDHKKLKLNPHSLRHLQHEELFRLGVADTMISKHFNRRSVAQAHTYDHRSLSENLEAIDLPEAANSINPKSKEVLKLILGNKVRGPLVDDFLDIQLTEGDEAAFSFLSAEADGLHVTPYGFCINSFTVDPCPKHLECFNGCRHLTRTSLPEEEANLIGLQKRMISVLKELEAIPEDERNIGWRNQIRHAKTSLENLEKAIKSRPGDRPFPDGDSRFVQIGGSKSSVIDSVKAWRPESGE